MRYIKIPSLIHTSGTLGTTSCPEVNYPDAERWSIGNAQAVTASGQGSLLVADAASAAAFMMSIHPQPHFFPDPFTLVLIG